METETPAASSFGDDYKRRFLNFILAREQQKCEALEKAREDAGVAVPGRSTNKRSMFYGEMVALFQKEHPLSAIKSALLALDFPLSKSLFSAEEIEAIQQTLQSEKERKNAPKKVPSQPTVGADLATAKSPTPAPPVGEKLNMVSDDIFRAMCRVFKQTDRFETGIVQNLDFIRMLRHSDQTGPYLASPAIYYSKFQKTISLAKFLDYFEFKTMYAEENLGVKPVVTWADFVELFGSFKPLEVYQKETVRKEIENRYTIVLQDEIREAIEALFQKLKNEENLVRKDEFLAELAQTPLIANNLDTVFKRYRRTGLGGPEPPAVDVKGGLLNVAKYGDRYIDLKEFFDFFMYFEGPESMGQVFFESGKEGGFVRITEKFGRQQTFLENNEEQLRAEVEYHTKGWQGVLGLDSTGASGNPNQLPGETLEQTIARVKDGQEIPLEEMGRPKKYITVPEPFKNLDTQGSLPRDTITRRRFQDYLQGKENEVRGELTGKPKINPAPSASSEKRVVLKPPKPVLTREKFMDAVVERNKATENPFSFTDVHFKSKNSKPAEAGTGSPPLKVFSAKEVPWFCAPNVMKEKYEAAEKERQRRIEKRANEVD